MWWLALGDVNIGIIFCCIANSQWCIYNTQSKSDWLFNTQSRVLQANWGCVLLGAETQLLTSHISKSKRILIGYASSTHTRTRDELVAPKTWILNTYLYMANIIAKLHPHTFFILINIEVVFSHKTPWIIYHLQPKLITVCPRLYFFIHLYFWNSSQHHLLP